jgi:thiol-disulfide isomerase/thioredoxin
MVVNLWATWCGPCRAEMPVLAAAQRARPDVRFVFANQGEGPEVVQRYLAAERLALQDVWLDIGSGLGPALGSRGLPTTVFFDADGTRVDAHFGLLNAAALQARLARWPPPAR